MEETEHGKIMLEKGNLLFQQGKLDEAAECFEKSLAFYPLFYEAYIALGKVMDVKNESRRAIACFQNAMDINPSRPEALSGLVVQFRKVCYWDGLRKINSKLSKMVSDELKNSRPPGETPYENINMTNDLQLNFQVASWWGRYISTQVSPLAKKLNFRHKIKKRLKIKLGYFSCDFREHPVGRLTADLFKYHDRDRFEIYVYSYSPRVKNYYRDKISKDCDRFIDLNDFNFIEAAKRIYQDKIDILIDLMGYSGSAKPELMALKPAPVQVSYLGFPGTMGADFIDYVITDKIITPPGDQKYYREHFIYMPDCYQVNSGVKVSNKKFKRQDFGLPANAFVFASFNRPNKIDPVVFNVWMNILKKVPQSVLWIYVDSREAENNLLKEAELHGIEPERLVFAKKIIYTEHLARLSLADLALDTNFYSGGATTSDALRMGVPVVTVYGRNYLSRMSSSLLTAVGMNELITTGLAEYEALAVNIAENPKLLKILKAKLTKNIKFCPLFDTAKFVINLEKALLNTILYK